MHTCEYCGSNTRDCDICKGCITPLCKYCIEKRHDQFDLIEPKPWINIEKEICCYCTKKYKKRIFKDTELFEFILKDHQIQYILKEKYK